MAHFPTGSANDERAHGTGRNDPCHLASSRRAGKDDSLARLSTDMNDPARLSAATKSKSFPRMAGQYHGYVRGPGTNVEFLIRGIALPSVGAFFGGPLHIRIG